MRTLVCRVDSFCKRDAIALRADAEHEMISRDLSRDAPFVDTPPSTRRVLVE